MFQRRSVYLRYFNISGIINEYLLIFRHNSITGDWFNTNANEFLFSNSHNKYSLFGFINDDFKTGEVFEFIQEYPEIDEFVHWTQTVNPLNADYQTELNTVQSNSKFNEQVKFVGLFKSMIKKSFLAGSKQIPGDTPWYYAIGATGQFLYKNNLPGSYSLSEPNLHQVLLWIKITNHDLIRRIQTPFTCQIRFNRIKYSIIPSLFFYFS